MNIPKKLNINFLQDDVEKLEKKIDQSADLVVSKDLFEHLKYPDRAVKRISEVLRVEGICIHIIHLFQAYQGLTILNSIIFKNSNLGVILGKKSLFCHLNV